MMMMGGMGVGSMGGSMNASANMNGMGYMGQGNMGGMGYMPGMSDPNAMGSMNYGTMPGMVDPNAMGGAAGSMSGHGTAAGSNGLLGFGSLDFNSLISGLLNLAIDIFTILLIIGLIVGVAVLIKRYVFDGDLFVTKARVACTKCGQALDAEWACCPKCGEAKAPVAPAIAANPQTV